MLWKKKRSTKAQLDEIKQQQEELKNILQSLLNRESSRVNIQELHINEANFDELIFKLESIDVQELSGSLNLGNNFSPRVVQSPKSIENLASSHWVDQTEAKPLNSKTEHQDYEGRVFATGSGYRFSSDGSHPQSKRR
ncbi:hypothetical protein FY534_07100 [Alicyclobacillus sp. TC]|uniref:Seryl-tRNA synthetase n=1 Tax=Alicyclobacillus tolerans TaxID=90970 RepID=A0ABT9LVE2_9BACL|nr:MULTISPECIES: hypothetical protein [Alicyclobacillus]MDP9728244.1 seryl-tRNA synthetase [Alicyclobacillus tengchongensis]QRF23457.1 hypothetical protein FY534_07100 [Alicyclobacillus sp. TC]